MKKIKLTCALVTSLFASTTFAENVFVVVDSVQSSNSPLIAEIKELSGPMDKNAEQTLYSTGNHQLVVLDSDRLIEDMSNLSKENFTNANSIIIAGSVENNRLLAEYLIGYGARGDYLVIKGLNSEEGIELVRFDKSETLSLSKTAQALVKNAIN